MGMPFLSAVLACFKHQGQSGSPKDIQQKRGRSHEKLVNRSRTAGPSPSLGRDVSSKAVVFRVLPSCRITSMSMARLATVQPRLLGLVCSSGEVSAGTHSDDECWMVYLELVLSSHRGTMGVAYRGLTPPAGDDNPKQLLQGIHSMLRSDDGLKKVIVEQANNALSGLNLNKPILCPVNPEEALVRLWKCCPGSVEVSAVLLRNEEFGSMDPALIITPTLDEVGGGAEGGQQDLSTVTGSLTASGSASSPVHTTLSPLFMQKNVRPVFPVALAVGPDNYAKLLRDFSVLEAIPHAATLLNTTGTRVLSQNRASLEFWDDTGVPQGALPEGVAAPLARLFEGQMEQLVSMLNQLANKNSWRGVLYVPRPAIQSTAPPMGKPYEPCWEVITEEEETYKESEASSSSFLESEYEGQTLDQVDCLFLPQCSRFKESPAPSHLSRHGTGSASMQGTSNLSTQGSVSALRQGANKNLSWHGTTNLFRQGTSNLSRAGTCSLTKRGPLNTADQAMLPSMPADSEKAHSPRHLELSTDEQAAKLLSSADYKTGSPGRGSFSRLQLASCTSESQPSDGLALGRDEDARRWLSVGGQVQQAVVGGLDIAAFLLEELAASSSSKLNGNQQRFSSDSCIMKQADMRKLNFSHGLASCYYDPTCEASIRASCSGVPGERPVSGCLPLVCKSSADGLSTTASGSSGTMLQKNASKKLSLMKSAQLPVSSWTCRNSMEGPAHNSVVAHRRSPRSSMSYMSKGMRSAHSYQYGVAHLPSSRVMSLLHARDRALQELRGSNVGKPSPTCKQLRSESMADLAQVDGATASRWDGSRACSSRSMLAAFSSSSRSTTGTGFDSPRTMRQAQMLPMSEQAAVAVLPRGSSQEREASEVLARQGMPCESNCSSTPHGLVISEFDSYSSKTGNQEQPGATDMNGRGSMQNSVPAASSLHHVAHNWRSTSYSGVDHSQRLEQPSPTADYVRDLARNPNKTTGMMHTGGTVSSRSDDGLLRPPAALSHSSASRSSIRTGSESSSAGASEVLMSVYASTKYSAVLDAISSSTGSRNLMSWERASRGMFSEGRGSRTSIHDRGSIKSAQLMQMVNSAKYSMDSPVPLGIMEGMLSSADGGQGPDDVLEWTEYVLEVEALPMRDPVTGEEAILLLQTDITNRAQLEEQMAALTEAQLNMLENMFPRHVLEHMVVAHNMTGFQSNLSSLACSHQNVTIMFMDIVGFTAMSKEVSSGEVMGYLNELFTKLDLLVDQHQVYKVDTAGDCYIVAGGLMAADEEGIMSLDNQPSPEVAAQQVMTFVQALVRVVRTVLYPHTGKPTMVRVGMHTGACVSGLIGTKLPKFSLWGDTMNTASRMETEAKPGSVQVSYATLSLLSEAQAALFSPTGGIEVKGKGIMETAIWNFHASIEEEEQTNGSSQDGQSRNQSERLPQRDEFAALFAGSPWSLAQMLRGNMGSKKERSNMRNTNNMESSTAMEASETVRSSNLQFARGANVTSLSSLNSASAAPHRNATISAAPHWNATTSAAPHRNATSGALTSAEKLYDNHAATFTCPAVEPPVAAEKNPFRHSLDSSVKMPILGKSPPHAEMNGVWIAIHKAVKHRQKTSVGASSSAANASRPNSWHPVEQDLPPAGPGGRSSDHGVHNYQSSQRLDEESKTSAAMKIPDAICCSMPLPPRRHYAAEPVDPLTDFSFDGLQVADT